jgi:hypothetical protein
MGFEFVYLFSRRILTTVWLDMVAATFAALFVVGLVHVVNTLLAQHHHLTSPRNLP